MNPTQMQAAVDLCRQLSVSPHGERGPLKAAACERLGVSLQTLHRMLDRAGYKTGRHARSDKGSTAAGLDDLKVVSGLVASTMRKNGRRGLSLDAAVQILRADGKLGCDLSPAQLSRLLWTQGMHPTQMAQQKAAMPQRTLHPNHIWQGDASICRLYYLSNGRLGYMTDAEFNRNKPKAFERIAKDRLVRYVWEDHYTGSFRLRYYLGSETADNLADSFIHAVSRERGGMMHGVPANVMLDPGAANTAGQTRNLFERLNTPMLVNEVMSPRSKGGVESAQAIIERGFEARIVARGISSLDELNDLAQRWCEWFCAAAVHTRYGKARTDLWLTIRPEQLRLAPAMDVLRDLVSTHPEPREVSGLLAISYRGREFDVSRVPWVFPGCKVMVCVNPYRAPAVEVESVNPDRPAETARTVVEPIERNEAGFRVDAPVLGQGYKVQADTVVDRNRKEVDRVIYGAETLADVDAAKKRRARPMAHVNTFADVEATQLPTYMPRHGEEFKPERRGVQIMPLSVAEACRRLREILGDAYGPQVYQWVQTRFGEAGVPEEQIAGLAAQFARPDVDAPAQGERPALRVVAGGGG